MRTKDQLIEIGKCPKCNSNEGWYYYQINRIAVYYDFEGNQVDAGEGICEKELKRIYCEDCHTWIATYE